MWEREGNQIEKKEQKETQGRTVLVEQGRAVRKTISFQIIPRKRTFYLNSIWRSNQNHILSEWQRIFLHLFIAISALRLIIHTTRFSFSFMCVPYLTGLFFSWSNRSRETGLDKMNHWENRRCLSSPICNNCTKPWLTTVRFLSGHSFMTKPYDYSAFFFIHSMNYIEFITSRQFVFLNGINFVDNVTYCNQQMIWLYTRPSFVIRCTRSITSNERDVLRIGSVQTEMFAGFPDDIYHI